MNIGGLQKFSLLDFPGRISAIVFTQGCNFRCPYCHNPELVDPLRYSALIPVHDVLSFLENRTGKLGAVTITGGEPTLQTGLIPFLTQVKAMGYLIKVDTNGSLPDVIEEAIKLDLVDYWAMDIKAPFELYQVVTQSLIDEQAIQTSMKHLRESGKPYEFRTTMFDKLLTWTDIERIKDVLHPGDSFSLQQCRYKKTLSDLTPKNGHTNLHPKFSDIPETKELVEWGKEHHIKVHLRTL